MRAERAGDPAAWRSGGRPAAAERRNGALGVLEAVAAASLWGTSGIFSVHLFRVGVTPAAVSLFRPLVALVVLVAVVAAVRPRLLAVDRGGLAVLGVLGGLVVALFQVAYQRSVDAVGVPSTVALLFLAPAIVVAASGPLLGEWPSLRRVGLALTVVTGVWLAVLGAESVAPAFGSTGVVWGLLAALAYAGYTLLGRYATPRWGSVATLLYSTAAACALMVALLPAARDPGGLPRTAAAWGLLAAYAVVTITVAQLLFYDALGRAEASRVSVAAAAEPVVAALLATLLVSQELAPLGWVGIALVVVGVVGVSLTAGEDAGGV